MGGLHWHSAERPLLHAAVLSHPRVHWGKYVGQPRDGSAIIPITDIGQTAPAPADTQQFEIKRATIVAIPQLDSYRSCLSCKARVEPETSQIGRCSRCTTPQRIDVCPLQRSCSETDSTSRWTTGHTLSIWIHTTRTC